MAAVSYLKSGSIAALALAQMLVGLPAALAQEATDTVVAEAAPAQPIPESAALPQQAYESHQMQIPADVVLAQSEARRGGMGGGNWGGSREGGSGRGGWGNRGGDNQASAAPSPAPAPPSVTTWNNPGAASVPSAPQLRTEGNGWRNGEQRGWSGGNDWRRNGAQTQTTAPNWNTGSQSAPILPQPSDRGNWSDRGRSDSYRRAAPEWNNSPVPQAQVQQRENPSARGREWAGRNPSYVAPDRGRNSNRDGWRSERRENDGNRWGYNQTNRSWNDANRWQNNRSNRNTYNDNRNWNRDWRRDDRYNWYSYRNSNRDLYRMGRYYAPYRGYNYRRLSAGFFLDSLFFSSNYWINDPWNYRLPDVDGPYRWVRYYDDALLVDTYSGEVVDVIYNFFW